MVLPRNIRNPCFGFFIRVKIIHSYKSTHKSTYSSYYNRESLMDLTQLLTCYFNHRCLICETSICMNYCNFLIYKDYFMKD